MIFIKIDGLEVFTTNKISILEACKFIGIKIPRFCYHETLSVSGNCRMCLVEINNSPKPVASCAMPVLNKMSVFTDTPLLRKARENVLEILLLNHPLDCPICDQGGECDLQEQVKVYGNNFSRFFFNKKGVDDKFCSTLIKTVMTRCIHCTRCVRFCQEVSGDNYFGAINRGGFTEISAYSFSTLKSEVSGNIIDLCPVGALTNKVYSFKTRPWEIKNTESIDTDDSTGSNILINTKNLDIVRILPKINYEINGSIITDKARFSFDSQNINRSSLSNSFFNEKLISKIKTIFEKEDKKTLILCNDEIDFTTLLLLKNLSNVYKNKLFLKSVNSSFKSKNIYITGVKNKIIDLNKVSKVCFLFSTNIKIESAIINTKLRLKFYKEDFQLVCSSFFFRNNYFNSIINLNLIKTFKILESKNSIMSKFLTKYPNPIFLIGESIYKTGVNIENIILLIKKFASTAIILEINFSNNSEGLKLLGIKTIGSVNFSNVFALNLDDTYCVRKNLKSRNVFWFNSYKSIFFSKTENCISTLVEYEEEKILINLEQRPQKASKITTDAFKNKSLFGIFNLFVKNKKTSLSYSYVTEIINTSKIFNLNKNKLTSYSFLKSFKILEVEKISFYPVKLKYEDFFQSNQKLKNSRTMLICSNNQRKVFSNFTN